MVGKISATCVALVLAAGAACVNLVRLSVITTTYIFAFAVLERGPKISIATNSSVRHGGSNWVVACVCIDSRFGRSSYIVRL